MTGRFSGQKHWTFEKEGANSGSKNPMFGKKHSLETLAKMRKRVYVYDANSLLLIKEFPGMKIASKSLSMSKNTILKHIRSKTKYKDMIFSYTSIENPSLIKDSEQKSGEKERNNFITSNSPVFGDRSINRIGPAKCSGKTFIGCKLSNSGQALKLMMKLIF